MYEIIIFCYITSRRYYQTFWFLMVHWLLLFSICFEFDYVIQENFCLNYCGEDLWSLCVLHLFTCTHKNIIVCGTHYGTNILWFLAMQNHGGCHEPIISSRPLHHHILITSGTLVSLEQNQTATLKCTHTHTHAHKYPTPSVPNCGWHIKELHPWGGSQGGLGTHGRQRKWLRDKDQTKIWHFILGRSGRHTPFRVYIATEGWRKKRRRKHEVEGFPLSLANISPKRYQQV